MENETRFSKIINEDLVHIVDFGVSKLPVGESIRPSRGSSKSFVGNELLCPSS